jgi:ATP-binding cassette subfamily B protein
MTALMDRHRELYQRSWKRLTAGIGLAAIQTLFLLPVPLLIKNVVDDAIPNHDQAKVALLGLGIVGLTLLNAVATVLARRVTLTVTKRAAREMRMRVLQRLYDASRQYHVTADQGAMHDRAVHETERVDMMTSALIADMVPSVVLATGLLGVLVSIDWLLTIVTVASGAVFALSNKRLVHWLESRYDQYQQAMERFSRGVLLGLRGQELTRIQGAEHVELHNRDGELADLERTGISRSMGYTVYDVSQQALLAIVGAVILIVGGLRVTDGAMSIGDLISFYAGFALLRGPLSSASGAMPTIVEGRQAMKRLYAALNDVERRPYSGDAPIRLVGRLQLDHVSLAYGDNRVLHDVSFALEPGHAIALIGANGSGKSSVINLLLGQYRPDSGRVLADGRPYDEVDQTMLLQGVGVVPQVPFFFPGSVRENLLYGSEHASSLDMHRALHLSNAADFVASLPRGLETELSDDALTLSGGQRQRLALTRALLRNPAVLVLDEPTNHLDSATVDRLLQSLAVLEHSPAVLLVSHDADLLDHVDEIVRLDQGRVIEHRRRVAPPSPDRAAAPRPGLPLLPPLPVYGDR